MNELENNTNQLENNIEKPEKDKSGKGNFKALLFGMLGALIVIIAFLISGLILIQTIDFSMKNSGEDTPVTTTISTDEEKLVGDLYKNSVDSVVTVVNQRVLTVNSEILQRYIDSLTEGQPVQQGIGSGFVYKKEDGYYYALTNNHVVDSSDELSVITTGSAKGDEPLIDAQILGTDPLYDVAVIRFKTKQDIKPLEFANSDEIYPGQLAFAIGSPYGAEFQGSITSGIVSAPIRTFTGDNDEQLKYIQTDAAINPGNSGGPLLNSEGKVIGMNTLKIAEVEADNMGFSIPTNVIIKIAADIEEQAQVTTQEETGDTTFEDSLNDLLG